MSKNFFIQQLKHLPTDRQLELHETIAKICCPIHNNGKERTPSLIINLERKGTYKPGQFACFGCGEHGKWNQLAKLLKLKPLNAAALEVDLQISQADRNRLLGNTEDVEDFTEGGKLSDDIQHSPIWEETTKWRGISGKLLATLEARLINTDYGPRLYLPVHMHKKFHGGITCRLEKAKNKSPSYIYDAGNWVKKSLFPFDYTRSLLKLYKHRVLFYGEGARDALNPLQYGVPTVANLGGITQWSKAKADLIRELRPHLLIIATDPDEIGEKVAEAIQAEFKHEIPIKRLKFPSQKDGSKSDPGNTPKSRWLHLKEKLRLA